MSTYFIVGMAKTPKKVEHNPLRISTHRLFESIDEAQERILSHLGGEKPMMLRGNFSGIPYPAEPKDGWIVYEAVERIVLVEKQPILIDLRIDE